MTPSDERDALARDIIAAMWTVSRLGDRALRLDGQIAFVLNRAWHALDEAERMVSGERRKR